MPTRLLRDWTDSASFGGLSAEAERLFIRLLMKADDYGRYHADPKLLKSTCFPLAPELRANTIAASLTELSNRRLVFCYTSGNREYLVIPKFGTPRAVKPKFPDPPPEVLLNLKTNAPVFVFGFVESERERGREELETWIERIRQAYPRQGAQQDCRHAIRTAIDAKHQTPEQILADVEACAKWVKILEPTPDIACSWVPCAEKFFGGRQWTDPKKFQAMAVRQQEVKNANPKHQRRDSGSLNQTGRYA